MCRVCERPCFRDGGEADCAMSDEEFDVALDELDKASGVIDLMERLQNSLAEAKRQRQFGERGHGDSAP